ncbi:1,6-anhydro-N-acetylmuramyl-L-alanine amidase AmpD [Halopseudomonas pelagia]|uniref:1,6-anhydro-N-acetylmuramyl-L-alanine amidase AmpD n=1 Tax=Halopseudomonas pelagia TaxID=553151 RepID=UPI00039D4C88|nr:1,6-anhydro-N-acetylmuramyl-L-alanine amidase AmpD [Halopseudomonas pelagia]
MQINSHDGWCSEVNHCPSPHHNERPAGEVASLLVIHNISLPPGRFGGGHVQAFFQGHLDSAVHPYFAEIAALKVSAHFLIERDGTITQFVSCLKRAWHAGRSQYGGRPECNDYSIGIELEGTDDLPFTPAQYDSLQALTKALQYAYPDISRYRITGHEFIAPGRKTDPGVGFDWQRYFHSLNKASVLPGSERQS